MTLLPLPPFFVQTSPTTLQVAKDDIPRALKYIRNSLGKQRLIHENKDVITEPCEYIISGKPEMLAEVLWDRETKSRH